MEARGLTEAGLVSNFSNIQVSLEVCEREGSSSEGNEDDLTEPRDCNDDATTDDHFNLRIGVEVLQGCTALLRFPARDVRLKSVARNELRSFGLLQLELRHLFIRDSGEDCCYIGLLPPEGIVLPVVNAVGKSLSVVEVRMKAHGVSLRMCL